MAKEDAQVDITVRHNLGSRPQRVLLTWLGVSIAAACGGSSEAEKLDWPTPAPPLPFADYCQPLLAELEPEKTQPKSMCFLPYQSDLAGPTLGTKELKTESGHPIYAGWSTPPTMNPGMFATLPGDLVADGFPGELDDVAMSTSPSAPIWVVEAEVYDKPTRMPFAADLIDTGDGHKLISIFPRRPVIRREVVLLRGVRVRSGEPARQPEGFRRISLRWLSERLSVNVCGACRAEAMSGQDRANLSISPETCRAQCTDEDPRLDKASTALWMVSPRVAQGYPTKTLDREVQLGWQLNADDFGRSEFDIRHWRASAQLDAPVRINAVETKPSGARILRGIFASRTVDRDGYLADLQKDVEVTIVVPARLATGGKVGRALLWAPRAVGTRADVESAAAIALAEQLESVLFSVDWVGSVGADTERLAKSLTEDPLHPRELFVDARQSIWNWIELGARIRKEFTLAPELMTDGKTVYDSKEMLGYVGTGHFLDGALPFELAARIYAIRAVLVGGGGGLTTMIEHSTSMAPFRDGLRRAAGEPMLAHALSGLTGAGLAGIDPIVAARARRTGGRPFILVQAALGDTEVSNLATSLFTQTIGATQTMPTPYVDPLLAENPFLTDSIKEDKRNEGQSFVTYFDYGARLPRGVEWPKQSNGVHDKLLQNKAAIRQMDAFFRPNAVAIHPCDGPCDPE